MKQLTLTVLLLVVVFGLRAQSLLLTSPNGGEVWLGGSVHNITWTYSNVDNIKIEYSLNNGLNWTIITPSYPCSALSYSWTVPCIGSNLAKVRITNTLQFTQDESNSVFTIPEPTVDITYPNGGESFGTGTGQYIEWAATGVTTVKVQYTVNNGAAWTDIGNFPAVNNYCNWIAPAGLSSEARIRAFNIESTRNRDSSATLFNVVSMPTLNADKYKGGALDGYNMCPSLPDTIRVLTPNGGEVYSPTNSVTLNWSFRHIDQIKIEYSTDNGSSWNLIVNDIPASQLSYPWTIPNAPSNQCRLKITSLRTGLSDISDAPFTINAAFVNVLYPNGGESFGTGTGQYIEWDYNSVATVKLEYSTNNGSTWTTIGTAPAVNKYANWIPPATVTSQCLIRISDNALTSVNDVSNAAFSLFNLPTLDVNKYKGGLNDGYSMNSNRPDTIRVTSPNGGELWTAASTRTITWTYNEVDNVAIELTLDDGATWTTLAASVPASQLSYSWTVPTTPSYTCRIRVRDIARPIQDVSDAVFIIPTSYVQITYPNGAESFGATTGQYIEWDYNDLATIKLEYSINNGGTWSVIGTAPAANKYANWVVPATASSQILIRATDIANPIYTDNSNAVFNSYTLPTLDVNKYKGGQFDGYSMYAFKDVYVKVIKPNGGEIWGNGTTQQIKWATLNTTENLKVEYSIDNESTWTTLLNDVPNSPVTFNWNIASPVSTICKVRATTMSGVEFDKSDDFFTIANPAGILTNPIAGNSFCSGESTTVTFNRSVDFNPGNKFIVQLSDSVGTFNGSLINIGEITATEPAPINVTFPPRYYTSNLYRLRVIGTNPPTLGTDNGTNFTINPLPDVRLGRDTTICAGTTITLNATSSGSNYLWSTGATTSSIQVSQAGQYWVAATNSCGTTRDTINVGILQAPTVNLGPDRLICLNSSIVLAADSGAYNYLWSTGAVTRAITVVLPGTYTVTVSNACGSATDNVAVSNIPTATINLGADRGLCAGESVVLNAGNAGATYLWSNGSTAQTITVTTPGTYSVNVTTSCGTISDQITFYNGAFQVNAGIDRTICNGESAQLTATGANAYSWNTGQTTSSITVSPTATTTYTVSATNIYNCTSTDAVVVNVNALPVATSTLSGPSTYCSNQPSVLQANGGTGLNYQWQLNGANVLGATAVAYSPTATGNYAVRVTNAQNCSVISAPQAITVLTVPSASITPSGNVSVCSGSSLSLQASSGDGLSYAWNRDGSSLSGANASSLLATQGGSYTVQVTAANGCFATSAATQIVVNETPTISIAASGPTNFCAGGSVQLTASATSGTTIQWEKDGVALGGATGATFTATAAGIYSARATSGSNCSSTSGAIVVSVSSIENVSQNESTCGSYTWPVNGTTYNSSGQYTSTIGCSNYTLNLTISGGTTCDDNDPCTANDVILADCSCAGTFADADNDGTCDASEVCEAPIAANIPQSITIECDESIPPFSPEFYMLDGSSVIVTQRDSIFSDGCSTIYIQEWIARNQCNDSTIVSRTINVVDTKPPTLMGCQSPIYLSDVSELASTPTISAIDNCSDNVQITYIDSCMGCTGQGASSHNLFTPARPIDNPCNYPYDWAMALFSLPSSYRWYQLDTNTHAALVYNNDSTVTLTGRVFNVITQTGGFNFNITYGSRKTWSEWTSDLSPSGFTANCGGLDANFGDWMYYILQPSSLVELTGWGSQAGSLFNLTHAPSNQYFGFQIGDGANNYNADYGAVSRFNYSGVFLFEDQPITSGQASGTGDFAFRISKNPNPITRTWTANDCAGNTSTCSQEFIFQNCNGLAPGSICNDNNPCTVNDVILTDCTCIGTFADADNDGTCDANDNCVGPEAGTACDDNNPCTTGDIILADCSCAGTFADADSDGTCDANDNCAGLEAGAACDDNNLCTVNDVVLADCSCAGTFADADNDGTCDANDNCAGPEAGTACDDNDPCTVGDVILADCSCAGTFEDADNDGTCDANDLCAGPEAGTVCDDNNPCTVNDTIIADCSCAGTFADADNDGTCDASDNCAGPEPGSACDDNDPCTVNDIILADCSCSGTFADADNDGTCDANDNCAGPEAGTACDDNNPCTINDIILADCSCAGTFADADDDGTCDANDNCAGPEAGTACDDNDPCTVGDVITTDCSCAGTFADADNDGTCDANDDCAGPEAGTLCDDNNPCTVNDIILADCSCAGIFADADNDGTCDANDNCAGPEAGSACDDNDPCTTGDIILADCSCAGTFEDADNDGTCDANDLCAGSEPGSACNDNNPCTVGDVITTDCSCAGTFADTDNDGTCDANDLCAGAEPGTACDDNDPCTTGDIILADCSCAGIFADADNDGTCDANDNCAGPEAGSACDDNDPCTTGDIILADCSCAGTFADADNDGTCDANDLCAGAEPGTACDDNDPCTTGDIILADCSCAGTFADTDNDGTCDANDNCAGPEAGAACDDNNPCTINDIILADCSCAGTFADADNDGTCDANDLCAGAEPGSSCDDGDACTIGDVILANCSCAGTFADSDNDGTCDANDNCAGPEAGTACDDNNPCTIGDVILADCSCAGTFADADNDGTCDANDLCAGAEPGTACDDNDPCTTGDIILADCTCAGTFADADFDGTCDTNDLCSGGPEPGSECNDRDDCTVDDMVQADCSCAGIYLDSDADGTCDAFDICADGPEPGMSCDDGNPCTLNDTVDENCSCRGTAVEPQFSSVSAHACGPYTWNNNTYTQSGTYQVTLQNAAGCDSIAQLVLMVGAPTTSSQSMTACGSYTWNGSTYTQSGAYTFVSTNSSGCPNTATLNLTINTLSVAPAGASASQTSVSAGTQVTLTVQGGSLGSGASWKWYRGACGGTLIGTGSSITVSANTTQSYFVRAEGTCNNTACASVTVNVLSTACGPQNVTATATTICSGSSTTLTVTGSTGTGGTWRWYKNGCGSGTCVGTSASITVSPNSTTTYFVRSEGGSCGTTSCRSITININSLPTKPSNINGVVSGLCGSQNVTYSTSSCTGATSYQWTVPTGATIVSGQGTASITVNFSTTLGNNSSCGSPAICVRSGNSCGWSSYYCKDVQLVPSTPSSISGSSTPCRNQPNVYSISAIPGATSYQWTVPSGYTIQSGQGTTSITVLAGGSSGSIGVRAVNACGTSSLTTKSVRPKTCTSSMPLTFDLWPNPTSERVFFAFEEQQPDLLEIYDLMGKTIYSGTWLPEFDVSNLAGGIYFVRATSDGESVVKRMEVVR